MTALDAYILFAIGFAVFALWIVREANEARRRLREEEKGDVLRACGKSSEAGADQ